MRDSAPLEHERTLELIKCAQAGDDEAQELLVVHNAALVKSIVKKYIGRGVDFDDLYQIGCLGLIKAIRNYDATYQVRFSTYAVPMIMGEVKRFLRDDGMIKVSRSLKELATHAAAAQEKLGLKLGREPTVNELAQDLGVEIDELIMAMEASRPHMSIYEPIYGDDSECSMLDKVKSQTNAESEIVNRVLLKELLGQLNTRERQLIMLRYFEDKTQGEIAKIFGVSQVQISRLEGKIIKKLRDAAT